MDTAAAEEKPFRPAEWVTGGFYALVLLWANFHVGRDFFRNASAPANSMHGFWSATEFRSS